MYGLAALHGVTQVFWGEGAAIEFVISLLMALAATNWAIYDRRTQGGGFHGVLRVVYFVTWPLASLVYLIATRKFRGLGWWAVNVVALIATMGITLWLTVFFLEVVGREELIDPTLLNELTN